MKVNNRLIAILTIALFAGNILSILPTANATVGGALDILGPDQVAAGGPIFIDATGMTATGGTLYFYLSLDDDPVINSGDIYFGSAKAADAITDAELQTLFLSASVPDEEYYLKCSDIKAVDRDAVVSAGTIEVISEDLPSVVNNDPTGNVGDTPEIEITDADAWTGVEFYWKAYNDVLPDAEDVLTDGEVTTEVFTVPDSYKGTYKIIVLLTDPDGDYATYVTFGVEPNVEWDFVGNAGGLSIEADELDQQFTIAGTGFPEGTVAEDSITLTLKNFMTGATIDVYETRHAEVDVDDAPEGVLILTVTADAVEAGVLDVKIPVDSSTETFAAAFYSSTPTAEVDFTTITHYKISDASGVNGDEITFSFINLGAGADVLIRWIGSTVTVEPVMIATADLFGAYEDDWEIVDLPGGSYTVRAVVTVGATTRERTIATFTVNPEFTIDEDEANVGDTVTLEGTGFPADATFTTVTVGGADDIDIDEAVLATGYFTVDIVIPEVSGGGKDVTVKVEGEDADGVAVSATSTIVINSQVTLTEAIAADGDWDGLVIFPGHIMRITGDGFLAGEALAVTLYDADDDVVGSAVVGDGEKADADGNVELIAWLPNAKALFPAGQLDCYLKVAGSTATNKDNSAAFDVDASSDALAFILLGIANDGDLDNEVKVGDTVRVVGLGFRTKTLTLTANGDDIKTVSSVNGYFDTTFAVPELIGYWDGGEEYFLEVDETGADSPFYVIPAIALSPTSGYVDSKFTVTGTGFEDGTDFDISWVGIIGNEVLDTVDGDDVEDGSFSIEVTVPVVVPQQYKVEVIDPNTDDVWEDAAYTVLDKSAVNTNQTLTEILAQLKALDIATLNTNVQSAVTTANAAKTAADAAKASADSATTTANAAKTAADNAKTAADSAKTAADAATAAANAAKTAADNAASSASGLTTLVYAAIGASLIAALAAIVALMQISRKIA